MSPKNRRGSPPPRQADLQPGAAPLSAGTPVFCLHYLHSDFHLEQCDKDARAAFAMSLVKRAALTWDQLAQSGRHKLGWEFLPVSSLHLTLAPRFSDVEKVMVMRYHGFLPMAGVRVGDTYHVLAIEAKFDELYAHGS